METQIIKYLFCGFLFFLVMSWVWYGLHFIIGSKKEPIIEFWTYGIRRFFKKKTNIDTIKDATIFYCDYWDIKPEDLTENDKLMIECMNTHASDILYKEISKILNKNPQKTQQLKHYNNENNRISI